MDNIWDAGLETIRARLYPFTFKHLIYVIIFTVVTSYIADFFFQFRLLKWIYMGTICVIAANLYNQGNDKKAIDQIFKLATIR